MQFVLPMAVQAVAEMDLAVVLEDLELLIKEMTEVMDLMLVVVAAEKEALVQMLLQMMPVLAVLAVPTQ